MLLVSGKVEIYLPHVKIFKQCFLVYFANEKHFAFSFFYKSKHFPGNAILNICLIDRFEIY